MSNIVRWIAALPLAAVCAYVAYLVGGFINNESMVWAFGPLEGWLKVVSDAMAHMYMGGAFVYCAVRFAPSAPKFVAMMASGFLTILAGVSLRSSFMIDQYYALPAIAGMLFGGCGGLVGTLTGEIVPYSARVARRNGQA